MKLGFIVEGFNDEASIREVFPGAKFAVTKGIRFTQQVKADIETVVKECDIVFIATDLDAIGTKIADKIINNLYYDLTRLVIEGESTIEHCSPEKLKTAVEDAIEEHKYGHLSEYDYIAEKIADKAYEGEGGLDRFKEDLYNQYEVLHHPKKAQCWRLAWDQGHSAGLHEVLSYWDEFVELIR